MNLDPKKLDEIFDIDNFQESVNKTVEQDSLGNVDISQIYSELAKLVQNGNNILSTVKYMIETTPDAEMVNSAANLMNSIRDTLKEFSKLHVAKIRHEQIKEIERIRINSKKEMLQLKIDEARKLIMAKNNKQLGPSNSMELVPFSQESIIKSIVDSEKNNSIEISAKQEEIKVENKPN